MRTRIAAGRQRGSRSRPVPGGKIEARSKIWLERDGKVVLSDWRVDLLEAIESAGSLARAAERMDVPYRTAWYKLKEMEDRLGTKLLATQSGGAGGGGSTLTPASRLIIERFRTVQAGLAETVRQRFEDTLEELLR